MERAHELLIVRTLQAFARSCFARAYPISSISKDLDKKKVLSVSFALVCFNYSYCSYDQLLGVGFRTLAWARGTHTLLLEFLLYSVKSSTVQQLNKLSQVLYTSIPTLLVNIFGL